MVYQFPERNSQTLQQHLRRPRWAYALRAPKPTLAILHKVTSFLFSLVTEVKKTTTIQLYEVLASFPRERKLTVFNPSMSNLPGFEAANSQAPNFPPKQTKGKLQHCPPGRSWHQLCLYPSSLSPWTAGPPWSRVLIWEVCPLSCESDSIYMGVAHIHYTHIHYLTHYL